MSNKQEIKNCEEKIGTANYAEMNNFPLYVNENIDEIDYWFYELPNEVRPYLDIVNSQLCFHKISVISGMFGGAQFWVDPMEPNWKEQPKMFPQYYNGRSREEVWADVLKERNEIRNWMSNWASHYGFEFVSQGIAWKPENIGKMVEQPF